MSSSLLSIYSQPDKRRTHRILEATIAKQRSLPDHPSFSIPLRAFNWLMSRIEYVRGEINASNWIQTRRILCA